MRIIGPPSAERGVVVDRLAAAGATSLFMDEMFEPLWQESIYLDVDPVGVIAQSYKETGAGRFGGRVRPWFCNPAGIKVKNVPEVMEMLGTKDHDHPLVHAQFPSWWVGARAQAQHLRAYAGWDVFETEVVDPRYWLAAKVGPGAWCENWADLGGRWAPSPTYGQEIEALMVRFRTR